MLACKHLALFLNAMVGVGSCWPVVVARPPSPPLAKECEHVWGVMCAALLVGDLCYARGRGLYYDSGTCFLVRSFGGDPVRSWGGDRNNASGG